MSAEDYTKEWLKAIEGAAILWMVNDLCIAGKRLTAAVSAVARDTGVSRAEIWRMHELVRRHETHEWPLHLVYNFELKKRSQSPVAATKRGTSPVNRRRMK